MAMSMAAQKLRWCSPYTGYSNTENFKIEEVVFTSGSTIIQADVVGDSGDVFQLSSEAYLSADGKRYPISKVNLISAALYFNVFYKYLSNKKLLRILPCQKFHLS